VLASRLEPNVRDAIVRQVLRMLVRVTTFANDPEHQSAGAALDHLQLGVTAGVLYVDGGWQTTWTAFAAWPSPAASASSQAPTLALETAGTRDVDADRTSRVNTMNLKRAH
jgi:hypothetical protein